jgi:hypothetical protein
MFLLLVPTGLLAELRASTFTEFRRTTIQVRLVHPGFVAGANKAPSARRGK